ncbi:hypothetical protein [Paraburkholderia madseniana]|nr:hypothetical protein [Paraburkholderia madseniana]
MIPNTSPFEYLLAYAIVFMAGILTTIALRKYTEWVHRNIQHV